MKVIAHTYVGDRGWTVSHYRVEGLGSTPIASAEVGGHAASISAAEDGAPLITPSRETAHPAVLTVTTTAPDGERTHAIEPDEVTTAWADLFSPHDEQGVRYRLYEPSAPTPRPLILFLHGGGEAGTDNWAQMVGTLGAAHLAQTYPDFWVMAPQAPPPHGALPPLHTRFADAALEPDTGWHRAYVASICGIVRAMIADGAVDPTRVYLTGMSMGGAGVIRTLATDPTLFAAAAPICPSMTPETFGLLRELTDVPLWVSSAYIDHTPYRHKYLVDAVQDLLRAGSPHARLTLFAPEQLEKYGLAVDTGGDWTRLLSENHASWVPALRDEEGILTWLTTRTADPVSARPSLKDLA